MNGNGGDSTGRGAGGEANALRETMRNFLEKELMAQVRVHPPQPEAPEPAAVTAAAAAPTLDLRLERDVLRIAIAALGIPEERIDPTENLANYGVDSIAITELMVQISRFFGVSIAPTTFFEARHLDDLSTILRARYGKAIAAHYQAAAPEVVAPKQAAPAGGLGRTASPAGEPAPTIDVAGWLGRHRLASASRNKQKEFAFPAGAPVVSVPSATTAEPIAIISMEGMFPQSPDLAAFETHLRRGDDCIEEIPPGRWDWRSVDGDPKKGPYTNVRFGGFIPGHDRFDAAFFNISPKEAELMDPQHRLFIECVWKLIEGAGYAPGSLAGKKVGIFLGINLLDYTDLVNRSGSMEAIQMTGLGHVFCPNRISFMLDVNGPSQVIDTACSSSLVAVHRAVMSIRHEGCEMAIAGGSNLMLTPTQHIMFSKVGMICADGRCKTFSAAANGYARAEGVGAVLLKRLDLAERDGDRILGVIRGSVENHGGGATSLTAPNPKAQARVIVDAHREAGFDPRTVTMIECHGTGTPLGDPIEVEGLKAAFAELYRDGGYAAPGAPHCGIGSVKSNIGHTEVTAGVAGLIKVLLSMQSGVLYKTLHCETPNPLIELDQSPFYMLDQGRAWTRPVVDGIEAPRRAALSSFGAGGANAHLVLEEYRPVQKQTVARKVENPRRSFIVPLSAKNEAALHEMARRLSAHLEQCGEMSDVDMTDLAYTLQIGRDEMRVRLACVVEDAAELARRLNAFLRGERDAVSVGVIERGRRAAATPLDPSGDSSSAREIAARWAEGASVDWMRAYAGTGARRVELPTYPFAGKRYWLPEPDPAVAVKRDQAPAPKQPFALRELAPGRYAVDLSGEEFFLADHRVQGMPVLPGVGYLELLRAAAARSGMEGFRIKQVVWLKVLAVAAPLTLEIAVIRDGSGWPRIEISSTDANGGRQIHGQARIADAAGEPALRKLSDGHRSAADTLAALQAGHPRSYPGEHIYRVFHAMQINYGPAHRAIRTLAIGQDASGNAQVLARLRLPDSVAGTLAGFTLHPSLMDGAFQAAVGVALDSDGNASEAAALPFALDAVEILGPCCADMWAHIRRSEGDDAGARVRTLDLDLMDSNGEVRVRMRGFATRIFDQRPAQATMLFEPGWRQIDAPDANAIDPAQFSARLALLCDCGGLSPAALEAQLPGWACRALVADQPTLDQRYAALALQLLQLLQDLVASVARPPQPVLLQVVIANGADAQALAGLGGMLRTAALEYPWLWCQLLAVETALDAPTIAACLASDAKMPQRAQLRHRDGTTQVVAWQAVGQLDDAIAAQKPWRDGGVYLISGGAGAIGQRIAREIALHAHDATVVLAGHSELDRERIDWLASTTASGASISYQRVDLADARAVADLVAGIRRRHGRLDGILHSAGVLKDALLSHKLAGQLAQVLAPKVAGAVHLDTAVGNDPLDFFVLFGSLAGVLGNPGQANYAAANAFLDGFAASREALCASGARQGRTLAIDWPLWRDGGMRVDDATIRLMRQTTGLVPLDTSDGLAALYRALASDSPQVAVAAGDPARVRQMMLALNNGAPPRFDAPSAVSPAVLSAPAAAQPTSQELRARVQAALMRSVSTQLKVALDDLDPDAELSEYGFDSISFTLFANEINDRFDLEITPTLFFEHPTIAELASHLAQAHGSAIAKRLGIEPPEAIAISVHAERGLASARDTLAAAGPRAIADKGARAVTSLAQHSADLPGKSAVAIIGMSGVFPMARDVDAFWQNLVDGRDCISEVPADRWDWRAIWGDPATEAGKTNVKWAGFIDGIAEFDPGFFGISAPEARAMDPQQRLLLTQAWRVIEDAGYAPRSLSGSNTGVFIGTADSSYGRLIAAAGSNIEGYSMTGLAPSLGPNRISFFLNLHGPSVAVETACSSALVAIHRAVEAIAGGGCDTAIAGGINMLLIPDTFIGFSKAGMLAPDGRSKPFSASANGYARGEGVGLIFLKKLDDAERDGDRILAVIRATAENHGGRASSLTAPNPKAQAQLLRTAYRNAGFDPRTVSYIETHGTGTPLGDPIEIEALTGAFADLARQAEAEHGAAPLVPCGIGSAKSNIGHLELAAGIAGVIKVLLQMKHRMLVKVLHCDVLNPYLKLDGSRFDVVRENRPWTTAPGLPLRSGVSSFGFGGSNAHVVLEEYLAPQPSDVTVGANLGPAMIVLSARSAEQLTESAARLRAALTADMALADLAFTLQVGRDAMEHRLAFMAASIEQVGVRLHAFVEGREQDGLHLGRVKPNREALAVLDADDEVRRSLAGLPARGKHDLLLQLWVKGFVFDWRSLYRPNCVPRRIALPGYPFARTQFWVRQPVSQIAVAGFADGAKQLATQMLHPLLQRNESDQSRRRFSSGFDGREFFLRDHLVGGQPVLPGVAYLEMARAALAHESSGQVDIELSQHSWLRPLTVKAEPLAVAIELRAGANGAIAYEISSESSGVVTLHSQGVGIVRPAAGRVAPSHDLAALRDGAPRQLDVEAIYRRFSALGIDYGPAHRPLRELRTGENLALARLALPAGTADHRYAMHPALLDGALQAILGLAADDDRSAALPYALKRVEVFGVTVPSMWAVVRREAHAETDAASYAIDLCDDAGSVCIRLSGFAVRRPARAQTLAAAPRLAASQAIAPAAREEELFATGESRTARALSALVRIAARLLEVDVSALEPDTELGEYGFDSITMTGFASATNAELGLSLTPADFFEFATLGRLAKHVADAAIFNQATALPALQPVLPSFAQPFSEMPPPEAAVAPIVAVEDGPKNDDDPVAIVGMSCCFPMAQDADAFWDNLLQGRDCITEIPADRWDWRALHGDPKVESNKTNIHWAGFIDGVFDFDPLFFGISPREAKLMDPQQRLLLQHVWKAIEDAGHSPRSLAGRAVGLFVGTSSSGYRDMIGEDTGGEGYVATGAVPSVGPNRVSYFLDWHGPSEPIETACSSSLVAIHRAIQAMHAGDCEMAVVGGVNTIVTPEAHINFAKAGMLSLDGRCKTFSAQANGYARGEGVGMLVLKPLSAARRDGDSIYALIRGSAINHGGRANSLTAPNTAAQSDLLKTAYRRAGIDPRTVGYIEAHGTGTPLGDPVEVNALKSAFRELGVNRSGGPAARCGVGSVKSNIGHLELASGVAGVIKVLLQMRHRTLVASLHCEQQNPYIDLNDSPFFIVRKSQPWTAQRDLSGLELPRRAGVSSFGFGGVNAHIVLEEYQSPPIGLGESPGSACIPLSARDPNRLRDQARSLAGAIEAGRLQQVSLQDLAYTLQVGREAMKHRLALEVNSLAELRTRLQAFLNGDDGAVSVGKVEAGAVSPAAASLAQKWVRGEQVDWAGRHPGARKRVHLPTYPFAREQYRIGASPQARPKQGEVEKNPEIDLPSAATSDGMRLERSAFYLRDHQVRGACILPGAMSLELVRAEFARSIGGSRSTPMLLTQIVWREAVVVGDVPVTAQVVFAAQPGSFQLKTGATIHVQGTIGESSGIPSPEPVALGVLSARCGVSKSPEWLYATYASFGLDYGPALRAVSEIHVGAGELLASLQLPKALSGTHVQFGMHPTMLDAAFQSCLGLLNADDAQGTALPFAIERLALIAPTTPVMWAHVREVPGSAGIRKLDIDLTDAAGNVCVQIRGFSVRLLGAGNLHRQALQAGRVSAAATVTAIRASGPAIRAAARQYFSQLVAAESAMEAGAIEPDSELEAYGIDSFMITRLTDRLELDFGPLSKTLFFEYRTLDAIVDHFIEEHGQRLAEVTGAGAMRAENVSPPASLRDSAPEPGPLRVAGAERTDRADRAIAIIGLAGRYPGARNVDEFWSNLANGRDCITEVPAARWDHSRFFDPVRGKPGKSNSKWGGFIDDFDCFDPLFFNISPREAEYIDPQERVFLQVAWETLEDAGYTRAALASGDPLLPGGSVGVFVGVMYEEYQLFGAESTQRGRPLALSGSPASIANRVSYFCNFNGPSMAVDSMCSSSLTAIHLACESLMAGSCEVALAGGVNLTLHPNKYLALGQGRFTSSNGRCESFGKGGDGYVPGEGAGAVLLKPLDRAIADGDQIYGVIRGSALNHGGKTNGYSVPNPGAQAAVIARALSRAGVLPRAVSYIEAHGTGTTLGDPIEIAALAKAFRQQTDARGFCAIGSVKSNIGHCESAAGIAGLTKVLLQLKHRQLAPSLHAQTLNPGIDFANSPFVVQRRLEEWRKPQLEAPRIAGLSSFGAGGSNAHFVIEEYIAAENSGRPESAQLPNQRHANLPHVFPLSARDNARLDEVVSRLLLALESVDDDALPAIARVLQEGRESFEVRVAVVAADRGTLVRRLRQLLAGEAGLPDISSSGGYRAGQCAEVRDAGMEGARIEAVRTAVRWTQGGKPDWRRLHDASPMLRKISLPTYPFARERCWIPGGDAAPAHAVTVAPDVATPDISTPEASALPLLLAPHWQAKPLSAGAGRPARIIIAFCDFARPVGEKLAAQLAPAESVLLEDGDRQIGVRFTSYAAQLLTLLQRIIRERPESALLQLVLPTDGERLLLEGLGGLLRSAQMEHPALRCQLIALGGTTPDIAALVRHEQSSNDIQIRHIGNQRLVRSWRELPAASLQSKGLWKDGGVYLITGGAGGVGLLLAEEIARSVRQAVLCVTGRSELAPAARERLDALSATVIHRRVDVTNAGDVMALVQGLRGTFGKLDGIVHAAGLTRDKTLIRKNPDEVREVLAPKVAGLVNLDAASADGELDFMLLFGSASGAMGNPGQADYAAANAFMDSFAAYRNQRVAQGERRGVTLAVDWPYWRDGGMRIDAKTLEAMRTGFGVTPLETEHAMLALGAAVQSREAQVLVLSGEHARLRRLVLATDEVAAPRHAVAATSALAVAQAKKILPDAVLREKTVEYVTARFASALMIPVDRLAPHEPIDRYGIDSVLAVQIIEELERDLGQLPKTLLFEYPQIALLAGALLESHREALRALLDPADPTTPDDDTPKDDHPTHTPAAGAASQSEAVLPNPVRQQDIAVIAVAGRYPGADTIEAFWEALKEGRDCITEIPAGRWDHSRIFSPEKGKPGASYCNWGGFLSDVDCFDPAFFGLSAREAVLMDPQERLFLQTVWHLLERACHTRDKLREQYDSRVGVYVGAMYQQYHAVDTDADSKTLISLSSYASMANRVSYFFDLQGPSLALDSMCSSGLQAVHLACQSLQRGECRLAIAGGVNLTIHPNKYLGLSRAGMLGSHAESRSFADGDGYLPAEGVGAVLLKPLADALRDGDKVLAVIKGSASNHGGHSAGYAVPNMEAQARLIADNFRASGIDPRSIGYVEAAANGSALGDAIEVRALARAFRAFTPDTRFCAIGSVKSNMGHAEAASGMAQLTKVLLQLEHRQLAPSVRDSARNPNLQFEDTPFMPQTQLTAWDRARVNGEECPLRATVSSFGAGGSNVHLILEEGPGIAAAGLPAADVEADRVRRFQFSARNRESLTELLKLMHDFVLAQPQLSLAHLAQTLRTGREQMACRIELVASNRGELLARLNACQAEQDCGESGEAQPLPAFADALDFIAAPPLVLPGYPFARERYWVAPVPAAISETARVSEVRTARAAAAPPGREQILARITALMCDELGIAAEAFRPDQSFRSHGGDSMFSLRLMYAMSDELGIRLTHRELEENATPELLAAYAGTRLGGEPEQSGIAAIEPALDAIEAGTMPLSEGQTGLWVIQQLFPATSAYNVPLAFRVEGIGLGALEFACRNVLDSFPILSTVVDGSGPEPRLVAHRIDRPLQVINAPQEPDDLAFARSRAMRPFDLAVEAPIRFELLRCKEEIVLIVVHHIVFDGVSAVVFTRAFWDAYERYATGGTVVMRLPQTEFSGFVRWERRHLQAFAGKADLAYWKQQLAGDLPVLQLRGDRPADPTRPVIGQSLDLMMEPARVRAARKCAAALGINLSVFFLGVLKILLYRYTGQTDILIGVPALARPERRFERTVGYFANVMPIRSKLSGSLAVAALLKELRATLTDGLDHAAYPFAALARELGRKPDGQPLYQVSYSFQNFLDDRSRNPLTPAGGAVITHLPGLRQEGDGAFGIEIFEEGEQLRIVAGFDGAQFDASTVRRMLDHFLRLADSACADPESGIAALDMMSGGERERVLTNWSRSARLPVQPGTVHQWIRQQALRTPDALAVVSAGQRMSYRELLTRSERLAGYLRARGVKQGMPVAVLLERGVQSIVALLAVLKAGAAWVPLDAEYPDQRLSLILADIDNCAMITDAANENRLDALDHRIRLVVQLDRDQRLINRRPRHGHMLPVALDSTAYIIYTSGSTGRPKGVPVSHRAIAGHCLAVIDRYRLVDDDAVLQFASHNVDAALEQILPTLICGARLILRGAELWSPDAFRVVLDEQSVTVADIPPAYLREVLQAWADDPANSLKNAPKFTPRMLIVGGEALAPETVRLWQTGPLAGARLLNAYGPTEATITCTVHEVGADAPGSAIPIGRPLAGGEIYILDRDGRPVPEGVPGELHIGGMRVARGYRGMPALTQQRFVPNPFATGSEADHARLYRSGDLASFIPGSDGLIAFLGRLDHQVKIRGFRIELGDIEAALRDFGLRDAVVLAPGEAGGERSLIACVVPQGAGSDRTNFDRRAVTGFLAARLPSYMLPSAYVCLEALPMTPGGKLDRQALLALAAEQGSESGSEIGNFAAVAPRDALEQRLADLWRQVLDCDTVGVFDDFFTHGGHSLLAVRLLAGIRREFGRKLSIAAVLRAPTIAQQAQLLRKPDDAAAPSPLVLLREGGSAPPLYCIHPVGGNVACYAGLARAFGSERPVYGLQSPALEDGPQPADMEEMAKTYIAALRQVQPFGPWHLAGWSIGGVIAFEMARQLRAAGDPPGLLALIDSYAPALLEALEVESDVPAALAFERDLAAVSGTGSGVISVSDAQQRASIPNPKLFAVFTANSKAARNYRPRAYNGPVTLFCAAEFRPADATLGWGKLVSGRLATHELPGNHYSLLKPPQLDQLVAILSAHLQSAPPVSEAQAEQTTKTRVPD
jgi:amino acid adenylation domain-containing protein